MIFYFLYYFSSFHFIFIHSRFISFFLFSFFLFLLFSSTQVSSPPSFIFLFTSRTFQQLICFTSEREREREAGGDRGRQKDKAGGDRRSPWGTTMSAARPAPHHQAGSNRRSFFSFSFFYFYFSYLLVLIQLYFKNWILFCVWIMWETGSDRLVFYFYFFIFACFDSTLF